MKIPLMTLGLVALSVPAVAAYQGPQTQTTSAAVHDALHAADETYLCMDGHIINQVGADKFTFQDSSGSIVVEIKPRHFGTQHVTPSVKVRVCGETEQKGGKSNEFEAKILEVLR